MFKSKEDIFILSFFFFFKLYIDFLFYLFIYLKQYFCFGFLKFKAECLNDLKKKNENERNKILWQYFMLKFSLKKKKNFFLFSYKRVFTHYANKLNI